MEVSISKINAFKACRRLYELKYMENLEPVQKPEALEIGANYHKLLEGLNNNGRLPDAERGKELAMAKAYEKYVYPNFHVVVTEKQMAYDLGHGDRLVGIVDAIADDGHIVEHKSTGSEITEEYEYGLQWNEQILAYMLMTGSRKVWYTVCRKPTIRQKKDETEEDFFYRMVSWYDTETDSKIRLLEIMRTDEDVSRFKNDLLLILNEIKAAENNKSLYRNTCHCKAWGRRCEYSSICLNYDPKQKYIEFERNEKHEFKKD